MNNEDKDKLKSAVMRRAAIRSYSGLCGHLHTLTTISYSDLLEIFSQWPEYSGVPEFPVKSPNTLKTPDPAEAYMIFHLYSGEYGESRMRLLDFILENLPEYVELLP